MGTRIDGRRWSSTFSALSVGIPTNVTMSPVGRHRVVRLLQDSQGLVIGFRITPRWYLRAVQWVASPWRWWRGWWL
jgi:hypothetical protein